MRDQNANFCIFIRYCTGVPGRVSTNWTSAEFVLQQRDWAMLSRKDQEKREVLYEFAEKYFYSCQS